MHCAMALYCPTCGALLSPSGRFCTRCGTGRPDSPAKAAPARIFLRRRLTLIPLIMVMFFSVSGGPFGIEDAIGSSGAGLGLLLLLLVPVVWVLPVTFMVAELTAALPAEGGYYVWVKEGLGRFWGFQEGWWSWADSFLDMAIYPVLFADYLSTLLNQSFGFHAVSDDRWLHWIVTLVLIWIFALLNIRGVRLVGLVAALFTLIVLAPFVVMSFDGFQQLGHHAGPIWQPFLPHNSSLLGALGLGLFVVMWNYLGWDGPSTISGEITRPRSNYSWAMALAVPLVVAAYVFPVIAGLAAVPALDRWKGGAFPDIATAVGGARLGLAVSIAALVSAAGLFSALMLSNSRLPFVLAADGYLPAGITRLHEKYATPWIAIALCAAIYSVFTLDRFADLVEADVIVYSAGLVLEFAALIALRVRQPELRRPIRVPGGRVGLGVISLAPVAVLALAIAGTIAQGGAKALIVPAVVLVSGLVLFPLLSLFAKRRQPEAIAAE
jgi:amino acid transporter